MVSINTNLSSIIAQRSMTKSTNLLNQAIERMSTGYKINHAADNAANYSISQNINAQMSSYDIAADNISMGMDLVQTAQDTIAELQDRGSRLQAILTQARNGTYGASSLAALTNEAQALVEEINRLYVNTEYNGKHIFEGVELPDWAKEVKANAGKGAGLSSAINLNPAYNEDTVQGPDIPAYISQRSVSGNNGFIQEIEEETPEITLDERATSNDIADAIHDGYTKIGLGSEAALRALASYVNHGGNTRGITFILTSDITIARSGWAPIGNNDLLHRFTGIFNGNGHTISGLNTDNDVENIGLFGCVFKGEIKNLGLIDCTIGNSLDRTGVIAGKLENGSVTNCYATGRVNGSSTVGGLVGQAYSSDISYSYSDVIVRGREQIGGLVGYAEKSDISYSYAKGSVNGRSKVGGLVGMVDVNTSITDSASTCEVKNDLTLDGSYTGSLIGYAHGGTSLRDTYAIESEYRMIGRSSENYSELLSCITVLNRDTLQHSAGYKGFIKGFVEETPEIICNGQTYSVFEAIKDGYTKIGIDDMEAFGEFLGCVDHEGSNLSGITFILTSDIDMHSMAFRSAGDFYGILNGNGHTVSNLIIDGEGCDNVGLFQNVVGGGIKNLGLIDCSIGNSDKATTGTLAGYLNKGFITNCYSTSNQKISGNMVGGLVGQADQSDISYSYANVNISGDDYAGGLVGQLMKGSTLSYSYAEGGIVGRVRVGGLVGSVYGDSAVTYSYATGNIKGIGNLVGGLVGIADGTEITNCYATGSVESESEVGGLVGRAETHSNITNCYATGSVEGDSEVGGLVGQASDDSDITNCYATGSVEGWDVVGGFAGNTDSAITGCYTTGSVVCVGKGGRFAVAVGYIDYSFAMNNISIEEDDGSDVFVIDGKQGEHTGAFQPTSISLQVGINGDSSSKISVDTALSYDLNISDITSDRAFNSVTEFLNKLNSKATELGAAQNRLESALESTTVSMDNLTSSLSTIRDADIAKVSSQYIRQQILQQAAATLMSTANQSPAIALQLI